MATPNFTNRHKGFTLIEVLIAVAIVGIVAAIAMPSYSAYMIQANRTDAMNFLSEIAGEQQKYFSENNVYASNLAELGYDSVISPEGYYTISFSPQSTDLNFQISATPLSDGRQAKDEQCKVFTIDSTGAKGNSGGSDSNCW